MVTKRNKNKIRCEYCNHILNGSPAIHTKCVEDYVKKVLNRSIIVTVFDKVRKDLYRPYVPFLVVLLSFLVVSSVSAETFALGDTEYIDEGVYNESYESTYNQSYESDLSFLEIEVLNKTNSSYRTLENNTFTDESMKLKNINFSISDGDREFKIYRPYGSNPTEFFTNNYYRFFTDARKRFEIQDYDIVFYDYWGTSETARFDSNDLGNFDFWFNGSLNASNITADYLTGDGSQLTGISEMNYTNLALTNKTNTFTLPQNFLYSVFLFNDLKFSNWTFDGNQKDFSFISSDSNARMYFNPYSWIDYDDGDFHTDGNVYLAGGEIYSDEYGSFFVYSLEGNVINEFEESTLEIGLSGYDSVFYGDVYADDYLYNSEIFDTSEKTALTELSTQKDFYDSKGEVIHEDYSPQILKTSFKVVNGTQTNHTYQGISASAMDNLLKQGILELQEENKKLKDCIALSKDFIELKECIK